MPPLFPTKLSTGQLPVFDPMRLVGGGPHPSLAVSLIIRIISREPDNLAFSLKSQNVRGDPVQEPAVVADHHGAARKVFQSLFQGSQGVHIQIVGRFVQQNNVAPFLQHLGQVDPVPLAAGKKPYFFLLLRSGEIESGNIGAGIDLPVSQLNRILASGDLLPDGFLGLS